MEASSMVSEVEQVTAIVSPYDMRQKLPVEIAEIDWNRSLRQYLGPNSSDWLE